MYCFIAASGVMAFLPLLPPRRRPALPIPDSILRGVTDFCPAAGAGAVVVELP